jgi:hypothetical protein
MAVAMVSSPDGWLRGVGSVGCAMDCNVGYTFLYVNTFYHVDNKYQVIDCIRPSAAYNRRNKGRGWGGTWFPGRRCGWT